jgi:hypothetical protein
VCRSAGATDKASSPKAADAADPSTPKSADVATAEAPGAPSSEPSDMPSTEASAVATAEATAGVGGHGGQWNCQQQDRRGAEASAQYGLSIAGLGHLGMESF